MFKPTFRNLTGVRYEKVRVKTDDKFNTLHDSLSDCYYNFWKEGNSKPFIVGGKTYDVQPTLEESKALFDQLHGLLWNLYDVEFHKENKKLPKKDQADDTKYNTILNKDGAVSTKDVEALKKIAELRKVNIIIDL